MKNPSLIKMVFLLALVTGVPMGLAACNGSKNNPDAPASSSIPSAVAQTPEQHAYALYGEFVVAEEVAATVSEHPATPQEVREKIAEFDAKAKPIADKTLAAAREVMLIRAQIRQGLSTEEKLATAVANLDKWVKDLKPKVEDLVGSIQTPPKPTE